MPDNPHAITVTINPTVELPQTWHGRGDEEPWPEPISLYDCIIKTAVQQLVGYGEKVIQETVREQITADVVEAVTERLPAIITDAFEEPIAVGDGWSSSEKKSIRDLIGEIVKREVRGSANSYDRTVLQRVFREEVERALDTELREHVQQAKAALKADLQAKAAELLAAETLREAGVR